MFVYLFIWQTPAFIPGDSHRSAQGYNARFNISIKCVSNNTTEIQCEILCPISCYRLEGCFAFIKHVKLTQLIQNVELQKYIKMSSLNVGL